MGVRNALALLVRLVLARSIELAVVRPFASRAETGQVREAFDSWNTHQPCRETPKVPIDLFLVYSRSLDHNAEALHAVRDVEAAFRNQSAPWHHCFRSMHVLTANLSAEEDVYNPRGQAWDKNWVRGPNAVFRFLMRSFLGSQYEAMFLMEFDSIPRRPNWLGQYMREVIDFPPAAIRGSRYRGDNWDSFIQQTPAILLAHVNGNAIYNLVHPLMVWLSMQLHQDVNTNKDRIAYDVRLAELALEAQMGATSESREAWSDIIMDGQEAYSGDSVLIGNYANTLLNESFDGGEYIAHVALHNIYSELEDSKVTLAVSHFSNSSFGIWEAAVGTVHPFREILVLTGDKTIENGRTDVVGTSHGKTTVTYRTAELDGYMSFCELASHVRTEFFAFTDTFHVIASPVGVLMSGKKPVVPVLRAASFWCVSDDRCTSSLAQAYNLFGVNLTEHYDKYDTLFVTSLTRQFCGYWREAAGGGYNTCLSSAPTADDYFAWITSHAEGGVGSWYKQEDREYKGWRSWTQLHTPHPPDQRACAAPHEEDELRRLATNISNCTQFVERPDDCNADANCMWRPIFQTGKCIPYYDLHPSSNATNTTALFTTVTTTTTQVTNTTTVTSTVTTTTSSTSITATTTTTTSNTTSTTSTTTSSTSATSTTTSTTSSSTTATATNTSTTTSTSTTSTTATTTMTSTTSSTTTATATNTSTTTSTSTTSTTATTTTTSTTSSTTTVTSTATATTSTTTTGTNTTTTTSTTSTSSTTTSTATNTTTSTTSTTTSTVTTTTTTTTSRTSTTSTTTNTSTFTTTSTITSTLTTTTTTSSTTSTTSTVTNTSTFTTTSTITSTLTTTTTTSSTTSTTSTVTNTSTFTTTSTITSTLTTTTTTSSTTSTTSTVTNTSTLTTTSTTTVSSTTTTTTSTTISTTSTTTNTSTYTTSTTTTSTFTSTTTTSTTISTTSTTTNTSTYTTSTTSTTSSTITTSTTTTSTVTTTTTSTTSSTTSTTNTTTFTATTTTSSTTTSSITSSTTSTTTSSTTTTNTTTFTTTTTTSSTTSTTSSSTTTVTTSTSTTTMTSSTTTTTSSTSTTTSTQTSSTSTVSTTTTTTSSSTTTSTTTDACVIQGALALAQSGANEGQVKAAVTSTMSSTLEIPNGAVLTTVSATPSPWTAQYAVVVQPWQASTVEAATRAMSNGTTRQAFSARLIAELQALGAQASSLQIASFTTSGCVKLSDSSITTTKTTTTTTLTVTSTTTTSPGNIQLLGARLTRHFADLELSFNDAVALTTEDPQATSQIVSCADAFAPQTLATLGSMPMCVFTADRRTLRATLGSGPTISLDSKVSTKDGGLLHRDHPGWPVAPMLNATVATLDAVVPVQAVVIASPPTTQACGQVLLSSAQSTGSAGRSLATRWQFGGQTPSPMRPYLQASLDAASASGATMLQISPTDFSAAAEALKVVIGEAYYRMEVVFEVQATVTNWLGASDTASASVIVIKEQEPLPQIAPVGSTMLEVNRSEVVSFSVETSTLPPDTICSGTSTATSRRNVIVTWEYRMVGSSAWLPLDGSGGIVDVARPPNVVRFNPNTFQPLSQVSFRATASYPDTSSTAVKPYVDFSLSIGPNPPPVADISGPQETNTLCEFVLDATGSTDPTVAGAPALNAEWSCAPAAPGGPPCGALLNFAPVNYARADGTGARGMLLRVAGGQLQEGSYIFSVTMRRKGEVNGLSDTASIVVQVRQGAPPPITISAPWDGTPYITMSQQGLSSPVLARSTGSALCPIPASWAWRWAVVREDTSTPTVAGFLVTSAKKVALVGSNVSLSEVEVTTDEWSSSLLEPGRTYSYALLRAESSLLIQDAESQGSLTVDALQGFGVAVVRSESFTAIGVPSSGTSSVLPLRGEAIKTGFAISTGGWFTQASSLTYAMYRFPLVNHTLYEDAGVLKATPEFTPPTIDWDNKTSSNYWRNLGGRNIRTWGAATAISGVVFPVGSYYIIVRALDTLGGSGVSVFLGPIVTQPSGGVTEVDMQATLDSMQASNDPDKILNAVASVTEASKSTSSATVKSTVISQAVGALESVEQYVEADTAGVDKMSQAMANVLYETNAPEILTRASNVMDKTLDAALQSPEGGVTKEAADMVLEAISAISEGASLRVSTAASADGQQAVGSIPPSDLAKAEARAVHSKVEALTQKLATAHMNKLQVGQSETLYAVLGDGKGAQMAVDKLGFQDSLQAGVTLQGGLKVAPGSLKASTGRRLAPCNLLGVRQLVWQRSNPISWLQAGVEYNDFVPLDADVKVIEMDSCGSPVTTDSYAAPMVLSVPVPPISVPPSGYRHELLCVVYNQTIQAWTDYGIHMEENASTSGPTVNCLSTQGAGSYTSFWMPVPLPTTITSTSTATFTVTNTTTSTAPPPLALPEPEEEDYTVPIAVGSSGGVLFCAVCWACGWFFLRKRKGKVMPLDDEYFEKEPEYDQEPRHIEVEADPRFWEWARDWANSRRPPPFGEEGHMGLALARIPDPPPLQPLVAQPERPPISPAAMPAVPSMMDFVTTDEIFDDSMEQGVQVVVDPNFWDWAREWAQLRSAAAPALPPPPGPPGVRGPPSPGGSRQPSRQRPPSAQQRLPPRQPQPSVQKRRPSLEVLGLVDGLPRQGPPLPALQHRRGSASIELIESRPLEAWRQTLTSDDTRGSIEVLESGHDSGQVERWTSNLQTRRPQRHSGPLQ